MTWYRVGGHGFAWNHHRKCDAHTPKDLISGRRTHSHELPGLSIQLLLLNPKPKPQTLNPKPLSLIAITASYPPNSLNPLFFFITFFFITITASYPPNSLNPLKLV